MATVKAAGKWVGGIDGETPLPEAARAVLGVRLKAIETILPLADQRAEEDEEYVHQLRVATRRSAAALQIFRPCVRKTDWKRMRRRLRRLRRAAGDARECDVHRAIVEADRARAGVPLAAVLAEVSDELAERRREAQASIHRTAERYSIKRLRRGRRRLLRTLRPPRADDLASDARLGDAARSIVPRIIERLRSATDADLTILDNLHQVRIAGKRLRYALEVFRPCFGESFAAAYAAVEGLQEKLGAINDSNDMVNRVEAFAFDHDRPAAALAVEFYQQRRRERAGSFLAAWRNGALGALFEPLDRLTGPAPAARPGAAVEIETMATGQAKPVVPAAEEDER